MSTSTTKIKVPWFVRHHVLAKRAALILVVVKSSLPRVAAAAVWVNVVPADVRLETVSENATLHPMDIASIRVRVGVPVEARAVVRSLVK